MVPKQRGRDEALPIGGNQIESAENLPAAGGTQPRRWSWLPVVIGSALLLVTLWLAAREVQWIDVWRAAQSADPTMIALAVGAVLLVNLLKALRWAWLFYPVEKRPPYIPLFWSMMFGQLINLLIPVRLGEVARVAHLHQQTGTSRGQALGTLLIEKNLDMLLMALTAVGLVPLIILPGFMLQAITGAVVAIVLAITLAILAFRPLWFVRLFEMLARFLPRAVRSRLSNLLTAGLQGLVVLRRPAATARLVALSVAIHVCMWLAPWLLFLAFDIDHGLAAAALVNVGVLLGLSLPSAPAKFGVFELSAYVVLTQLGDITESLRWSYALVFHVVTLVPVIPLGGWPALKAPWVWRRLIAQRAFNLEESA